MFCYYNKLSHIIPNVLARLRAIGNIVRRHPFIAFVTGILMLSLVFWSLSTLYISPDTKVSPINTINNDNDVDPLAIFDVDITAVTESSATVVWNTNEPATSELIYWITPSSDQLTISDNILTMYHSLGLRDLKPDTSYHLTIKSVDGSGNESTMSIFPVVTLSALPVELEIGSHAPDFTLQNINGETVTLSDFRDKIVMVNFWNHLCHSCTGEIPHIQAVFNTWSDDDLVILAVHIKSRDIIVQNFVKNRGITFPVLLDTEKKVYNRYQVHGYPVTFFIDGKGIIRHITQGAFESQSEIEGIINSIIARG